MSAQDVNRRESLVSHTLPLHQILDSLIAVALRCKMKKKKPFKRPHVLTLKTIETLPRCTFSIQYFPHSKANGAKQKKKKHTKKNPTTSWRFARLFLLPHRLWNSTRSSKKSRDPPPAGAAARHSASLICNKAFVFHYLCDVIRRCGGGKLLFTQKCQRRGELSGSDPR